MNASVMQMSADLANAPPVPPTPPTPPEPGTSGTPETPSPADPTAKAASYDPALYGELDAKTGRPAKVAAKYWDDETKTVKWDSVLEQHNWLQSKLGEKKQKPPAVYDLTSDADFAAPEGLVDDPVYKGMATYARESLELSQNQWDGLIRHYWATMQSSSQDTAKAEMAALGDKGLERVDKLRALLAAQAPPEIFQKALSGIQNAAAVEVMEWAMHQAMPPTLESGGSLTDAGDTEETLYQNQVAKDEYGEPKMLDPKYAAAHRARMQAFVKRNRL